jgi:hypothetical protein
MLAKQIFPDLPFSGIIHPNINDCLLTIVAPPENGRGLLFFWIKLDPPALDLQAKHEVYLPDFYTGREDILQMTSILAVACHRYESVRLTSP